MKTNITFFFLFIFCTCIYGQRTYKDTIDFEVASLKRVIKKSYSHIMIDSRKNYLSIKHSAIRKTLPDIIKIINDSSQNKKNLNKYKIKIDSFKNSPSNVHFQIYKIDFNDTAMKAIFICRCWANQSKEYTYMVFYIKKRNKWKNTGIGWQERAIAPNFKF